MVDLIAYADAVPQAGETRRAREFAMSCGGKGANQAVAARRLGSPVKMMARLGDDVFAEDTLANFRRFGIETSLVEKVPGVSSGVATIWVDADSQNRILIAPGANQKLTPAHVDAASDALSACSLLLLQLEVPLDTVYAAIDFGRTRKIPVLLNPAPARTDLDLDYARQCKFFVPNETELQILTDMPVEHEDDVVAAARTLLLRGFENLIVTLGEKGALWLHGDRVERFAAPHVHAVDTTGAGDAFIGCFANAYVAGRPIPDAIARAVRYASRSVTEKGTQEAYPSAREFETS